MTPSLRRVFLLLLFFATAAVAQTGFIPAAPDGDKCGFDPERSAWLQEQLGLNWGYSYDSLLADLGRWETSPFVTIDSIGRSVQNRPLWRLVVTDSAAPTAPRRTVTVHARTHPNEVESFWVTDAMINFLLSPDPYADFLRRNCTFHILPMYNPDGVELGLPRENANGIDIESGWDDPVLQPEVAALRSFFSGLMASPEPIEVALNMHSAYLCERYFVFHAAAGTSTPFTLLERDFIEGIRYYYPHGIQPWNFFITWTNGTPDQYPESWFWMNYREAVMALTYEDMNCASAGNWDSTAYAMLHGVGDYLDLVTTIAVDNRTDRAGGSATLAQNAPNPVHLSSGAAPTMITYTIDQPRSVRLEVFDVLGRRVATLEQGMRPAGLHRVFFDASRLAAGTYFYRLETSAEVRTRRLLIVR